MVSAAGELACRPTGPQASGLVHGFLYQAASWKTARRVAAKVEFYFGELFPRVGFIVTNLELTAGRWCGSTTSRGRQSSGSRKARRDAHWREHYYALLESGKVGGITFPQALQSLRNTTGRLEASFASRLVASVHPDQPIVDKFVLGNFGLHLPHWGVGERESKSIAMYEQLCRRYEDLMANATGRMIRDQFQAQYPWARITYLKMLDLVFWQLRPEQQ